jgi:hypothetical protein
VRENFKGEPQVAATDKKYISANASVRGSRDYSVALKLISSEAAMIEALIKPRTEPGPFTLKALPLDMTY